MCLGASRESRNLLIPNMQPFDRRLTAYGVGKAVEAVAHDAVDPLDASNRQSFGELVRDRVHVASPGSIVHGPIARIRSGSDRRWVAVYRCASSYTSTHS